MNKENIQHTAKATSNHAENALSGIKENMSQFLEDRKENFSDVSEYTNKGFHKAKTIVKNNPIYAVAGAFAAGALVSFLFRRK